MESIGTVMAPEAAPQQPSPKAASAAFGRCVPRVYGAYYENRLMAELSETGPVVIWKAVNILARRDNPDGRSEERSLRLEYVRALKTLIKRGVVRRVGRKNICLSGQEVVASEMSNARQKGKPHTSNCHIGTEDLGRQYARPEAASLSAGTLQIGESAGIEQGRPNLGRYSILSQSVSVPAQPGLASATMDSKVSHDAPAANPEHDQHKLSEAGRLLRKLPRRVRKRWTGWIGNRRYWRGAQILLPDGQPAFVFGVLRSRVVWTFHPDRLIGGFDGVPLEWGVVPAADVTPRQHPAAVLLGRLKAGKKERPSKLKSETARRNGRQPCRAGRRRGRVARAPAWIPENA